MTQLLNAFNPMDYDPTQGTPQLPMGKHPVIIESAEVKANNANTGGYLSLNLRIIDGPCKGQQGVYRLSIYAATKEGCDAGFRKLSAICHVTQTFQLGQDGQQVQFLFNKPFVIDVGLQKGEEAEAKGYTEVKRVFDMNGNEPGKGGTAPAASAPAGFGGGNQGGQNPNQGAASGPQGGANAWGGNSAPANSAPANNGGNWGASNGAGTPDPNAGNGAPNQGGGWAQNQGNGGEAKPAWGQR